jgi:hypothetical protein
MEKKMKLYHCSICQQHFIDECCPHCVQTQVNPSRLAVVLLLGLGLSACGEKGDDTGDSMSTDTSVISNLYGVEEN